MSAAKKKRRRTVKKKKINRASSFAVMFIAAIFILIMGVQIQSMKQEDDELAKKEQKLQEAYASEQDRTTELEEQELFVQTKQYIEEAAKKLGFVYPDEIIFKPSN